LPIAWTVSVSGTGKPVAIEVKLAAASDVDDPSRKKAAD
jgi:hypothetical protein